MPKNREDTVNTYLAALLQEKNPNWRRNRGVAAEQVGALRENRGRPDLVVLNPEGSPVIIETEYMPASTVEDDAQSRLGVKIAGAALEVEQVIALRMPKCLKNTPQGQLQEGLRRSIFEYCVYSKIDGLIDHPTRWPQSGWLAGDVDALVDLIENVSVSERLVVRSLKILEDGVSAAADTLRMRTERRAAVNQKIAEQLHQEDGVQTSRMAMAIIANALTFQTTLEGAHDILPIADLRGKTGHILKEKILNEWLRIIKDINYWPIFDIARRILKPIPDGIASRLLETLFEASSELAASGVTRSHDLSGRMFQRLISDRKFLATFYTQPASAAMLAYMAVKMLRTNWDNGKTITSLRIADLACGTGTLLVAAYHAIIARHRRAGGDDYSIHKSMMEKSLIAADIMPAAAHLTVSMLSSVHPTQVFNKTQVYTLPFGAPPDEEGRESGRQVSLGSLDLLSQENMPSLFGTGIGTMEGKVKTLGQGTDLSVPANSLDLVIMNPPFTAPTNHEIANVPVPSFGGFATPDNIQKEMSHRLKQIRATFANPASHGNAGLASNFLDLAHLKLCPGGVLALVLPLSIVQGESWKPARDLLAKSYEEIMIVTLAAAKVKDVSFSADTGMGEVLVVARKRKKPSKLSSVYFCNLYKRPNSIAEGVELARRIMKSPEEITDRTQLILIGSEQQGNVIRGSLDQGGCAGAADTSLAEVAMGLEEGILNLPRSKNDHIVPMVRLGDIGRTGPVHRDINGKDRGPFDLEKIPPKHIPTYPMLWAHNAEKERRLVLEADKMGVMRNGMDEKAKAIWARATQLHFTLDFRLNSQSLAACWTVEPTIGGTAWPNFELTVPGREKALLLWANTTLGLLLFWWQGNRQQSGRARITITGLPFLAALDVRSLTKEQLKKADNIFNFFSKKEFLPANEAYRDDVRQALDRAILVDLLGMPDSILDSLGLLREKWCAEPSVHGGKKTMPS